MSKQPTNETESVTGSLPTVIGGPIGWFLSLFSSIWLGVTLLSLLFIYSSIGSSGLPIGEGITHAPFLLRPDAWVSVREVFELSEFQWFHWWPFDLLMALICLNLVVATLRRIPFNVVNLGVWMIHAGIITLCIGSVWYFGTKVEGDSPVSRRQIVAAMPGHDPVSFVAIPGNRVQVGEGADAYFLEISGITPEWELLSGDDKGKRAYKVSVAVQGPGQMYIRELLAGYPQYTEDLVRSDDPAQPFARAKKTLGKPLVDETLDLSLEYHPQKHFYLMESAAVYLRHSGSTEWIERPIRNLPRFNDHISGYDKVTLPQGDLPKLRPLDVEVPPVDPNDPLPDITFRISDYLRYAQMVTERIPGGDQLNPAVTIRFQNEQGESQQFEMLAFDPELNTLRGGVVDFRWITSQADVDALKEIRDPLLRIEVPEASIAIDVPITEVSGGDPSYPFTEIEGSTYSYRVTRFEDGLVISGRTLSVAMVEIMSSAPDARPIERWVFDQPTFTGDRYADEDLSSHMPGALIDENIEMSYSPGRRSGLKILAGPGENDLRLLMPIESAEGAVSFDERPIAINELVAIRPGITLGVTRYAARSRAVTRPRIIPEHQRDRDFGMNLSMVQLLIPSGGSVVSEWLRYHLYAFPRPQEVLRRFPYQPTVVHLADGRHIEIMFSRERMDLPSPVVLEDFQYEKHIGGFSGATTSVRNWTSVVRFAKEDATWDDPVLVSVNEPQENAGFWFFQSQWDPPSGPTGPGDPGSAGLNYTVLGVGNREGVNLQLLGCCIAVIGMLYAFYVKPVIKRRRRTEVYARVAASKAADTTLEAADEEMEMEPMGAASIAAEESS